MNITESKQLTTTTVHSFTEEDVKAALISYFNLSGGDMYFDFDSHEIAEYVINKTEKLESEPEINYTKFKGDK